MAWAIRVYDLTAGSTPLITHFGDFSTAELAQQRVDTLVQQKSQQLSYTLELERDDKYDGYSSDNMISEGSYLPFHYIRDDNRDWVYTATVYNTDYPNRNRNDTGVIGDSDPNQQPSEGG